jgi:hypothetical protein
MRIMRNRVLLSGNGHPHLTMTQCTRSLSTVFSKGLPTSVDRAPNLVSALPSHTPHLIRVRQSPRFLAPKPDCLRRYYMPRIQTCRPTTTTLTDYPELPAEADRGYFPSALPILISILGFLWTTRAFYYFHIFRISQAPPGYEPISRSSDVSEDILEGSTGGGGALMKAYARQVELVLSPDSENVQCTHNIASRPEANPSENEPLLSKVANSTSSRFHPHQLYWNDSRSDMLFFLSVLLLVFSGISVIDNALQVRDCDNSRWRM